VYRREVVVPSPPGAQETYWVFALAMDAGDLDGDKISDLAFLVFSATVAIGTEETGLFYAGRNRVEITDDWPFLDTLDGGSDDRVSATFGKRTATFLLRNGYPGRPYWSVTGVAYLTNPRHEAWWGVGPLKRARRGRCADVVLYGASPGALWIDVLDGAGGRKRWSRTFVGTRPHTTVEVGGWTAACR
jgi:hypothetical protein